MLCFFFNDTATTEIYTLSLHDALPILSPRGSGCSSSPSDVASPGRTGCTNDRRALLGIRIACPNLTAGSRSEEHTSELQSRQYLVCRLLLEKKKTYLTVSLILYTFIQ